MGERNEDRSSTVPKSVRLAENCICPADSINDMCASHGLAYLLAKEYHDEVYAAFKNGHAPKGYEVWSWEYMSHGQRNLLIVAASNYLKRNDGNIS